MDLRLQGKYVIKAKITARTGLHIGGAGGSLEIGGVDNGIIKDHEGKPYIPGSSLKGKMRSLLEAAEGYFVSDELVYAKKSDRDPIRIHMCDKPDCPVCIIFGRNHGKHISVKGDVPLEFKNVSPTRLIVRDAYLIPKSIPDEMKENLDLEWTEVKFENTLDRITSAANPRQTERVPRGAQFDAELVYSVLEDQDKALFNKVLAAMKLLEDDALGGSGSRGYGKITFDDIRIYWNSVEDYEKGSITENKEPVYQGDSLASILMAIGK